MTWDASILRSQLDGTHRPLPSSTSKHIRMAVWQCHDGRLPTAIHMLNLETFRQGQVPLRSRLFCSWKLHPVIFRCYLIPFQHSLRLRQNTRTRCQADKSRCYLTPVHQSLRRGQVPLRSRLFCSWKLQPVIFRCYLIPFQHSLRLRQDTRTRCQAVKFQCYLIPVHQSLRRQKDTRPGSLGLPVHLSTALATIFQYGDLLVPSKETERLF